MMQRQKQFPIKYQLRTAWPYLVVLAIWLGFVGSAGYAVVHFVAKYW
jgi:hypothetical protein